jgi:Flp pilus assembly secretin CpaC
MARLSAALAIVSVCIGGTTAASAAELKACTEAMHAQAGCSSVIPVRIHRGGQTDLLVLDQPFSTVRILDPAVVSMEPVSDQSFYLSGQDIGRTFVKFFDAQGMALVGLDVLVGPPAGQVLIYDRAALAGISTYKCTPAGCELVGQNELNLPAQVTINRNTNRNIEETGPSPQGRQ